MTPEHKFLSDSLYSSLNKFSKSSLFGIHEAQRKTFDLACILSRDFSRPLVSQVLWKNFTGMEKDLRTLLHDKNSKLKVYLFKDSISVRAKIEEIITSYRTNYPDNSALKGLKLIPVPSDFNADKEEQQNWMNIYVESRISKDLLFNVIFGNFTKTDLLTFDAHGGPFGLKYALLAKISRYPLLHMPTFKKELGYNTSGTIREGLIMLNATGLIKSPRQNIQCFSTLKGRWLLDITRRLMFDFIYNKSWSAETLYIFECMDMKVPLLEKNFYEEITAFWHEPIYNLLYHALACKKTFGIDLLENIDKKNPIFYSNNFIQEVNELFVQPKFIKEKTDFFSDDEALLFSSDFDIKH